MKEDAAEVRLLEGFAGVVEEVRELLAAARVAATADPTLYPGVLDGSAKLVQAVAQATFISLPRRPEPPPMIPMPSGGSGPSGLPFGLSQGDKNLMDGDD